MVEAMKRRERERVINEIGQQVVLQLQVLTVLSGYIYIYIYIWTYI